MTNKFTQKAQNALQAALRFAREMGHTYVGSEHLLLGLLAEKEGIASRILVTKGVRIDALQRQIAEASGLGSESYVKATDMTPRVQHILEVAASLSQKSRSRFVGTEHILLALLSERDCVAVRLLDASGVCISEIKSDLEAISSTATEKTRTHDDKKEAPERLKIRGAPTLSSFGRDLTDMARQGRIDPIIGRDRETERVVRILSRRTKNNPCLVGEPGVGKTAVVEGLAERIVEGNVPASLADRRIVTLDISSMIAGAKYRGEFEERMKRVMEEVEKNPDIILFIDELHMIVGAGAAEGAVDAANILKPALARGEVQMIGATTLSEYHAHIERDAALERRFQSVTVAEPSPDEAERILLGLRERYEAHHDLRITDEAIREAVALSVRYIPDRFLPDKAIDLLDEAAAKVRIAQATQSIQDRETRDLGDRLCREKEEAIAMGDLERAATLRDKAASLSLLPDLLPSSDTSATPCVTREDVADVVTSWTGIPTNRLLEAECGRLLALGDRLRESVIGQDEAIDRLVRAIGRGRVGLSDPSRPIGSFLFAGPSGVGKTALCRSLAESLFGNLSSLVRLDMSEYMEKHSISKLIGSPPGYVGYGEGGWLTEKIRRNPYAVVLFDEMEKAHPDVFHLLLQILEDGTLTDSSGRRVDFRNTVIVMTTNLGASESTAKSVLGFAEGGPEQEKKRQEEQLFSALREQFRPELLGRMDEIIHFRPLSREDLCAIVRILLSDLSARAEALGISLYADDDAIEKIVAMSDSAASGARSLRRTLTRLVEDPLSLSLLDGTFREGDRVRVAREGNGIVLLPSRHLVTK